MPIPGLKDLIAVVESYRTMYFVFTASAVTSIILSAALFMVPQRYVVDPLGDLAKYFYAAWLAGTILAFATAIFMSTMAKLSAERYREKSGL